MDVQWRSLRDIPVPDFNNLFERIEVGEVWEPTLPLKYNRMLQDVGRREEAPQVHRNLGLQ